MSCDVDKATEGLENELWRRWSDGKVREWAELPSFYLRHCSFSNPSFTYPTSQALHLIHLASRPWYVCKLYCTVQYVINRTVLGRAHTIWTRGLVYSRTRDSIPRFRDLRSRNSGLAWSQNKGITPAQSIGGWYTPKLIYVKWQGPYRHSDAKFVCRVEDDM